MVNPINGDKPITTTTTRSDESSKRTEPNQVTAQTDRPEHKAAEPVNATLEVEKARQLYEMESQKNAPSGPAIETPEQARSVLSQILDQISQAPDRAMKTQASASASPLANLLEAAPA